MARTKASVGAKVSAVKSSKARAIAPPTASFGTLISGGFEKSGNRSIGGNPVCPRETPKWQKPITNFFIGHEKPRHEVLEDCAGSSISKKKRQNIIESDDEVDMEDVPRNCELEESFVLTPLDGEANHKIEEYYNDNENANKENEMEVEVEDNNNKRQLKRPSDTSSDGLREGHAKRIRTY